VVIGHGTLRDALQAMGESFDSSSSRSRTDGQVLSSPKFIIRFVNNCRTCQGFSNRDNTRDFLLGLSTYRERLVLSAKQFEETLLVIHFFVAHAAHHHFFFKKIKQTRLPT
jgi:hypothetical protein